jgi:hypothetical protein
MLVNKDATVSEVLTAKKHKMGGARPGSGRKPGSKVISIEKLKQQYTSTIGKSFEEVVAETSMILFNNFQQGVNVQDHVRFMTHLMKYFVEAPVERIEVVNPQEIPDDEVNMRVEALIARAKLSSNETANQG